MHSAPSSNASSRVPASLPAKGGSPQGALRAATLDDPWYYLHNVTTVLDWVECHHADLWTAAELQRFASFRQLSRAAQALLTRLMMRTHVEFRVGSLHYPELGTACQAALDELVTAAWLEQDPALDVATLGRLLRHDELYQACQAQGLNETLPRSATKTRWLAALQARAGGQAKPLAQWWPATTDRVVVVPAEVQAWFRRVRLMFFGNLRQDWSEFVITELGHQRYAAVAFEPASRAFSSRDDVDHYLILADLQQQLADGVALETIWAAVPPPSANAWLAHRRSRVLLALGRQAARHEQSDLALAALEASAHPEAQVRALRLRERHDSPQELWTRLETARAQSWPAEVASALDRLTQRTARRLGRSWSPPARSEPPRRVLRLRPDGQPVELAVARALSDSEVQSRYVENHLFPGLLALLCWPAVYAALPGAFFHPFQAGPADLYRPDFAQRRSALLAECLATLEQGSYHAVLRQRWHHYRGVRSALVNWAVLDLPLLELALSCVPASVLRAVCLRLLDDLRHHSRGMPDLVRFWPEQRRFALVEVKAPGDRLQDHQRAWLGFFQAQGVAVEVCHVEWIADA